MRTDRGLSFVSHGYSTGLLGKEFRAAVTIASLELDFSDRPHSPFGDAGSANVISFAAKRSISAI
jgi:hypothetical protein